MPRRAALSVLNALTALLIAPDLSSDLALSHFSPSSHHPNSLSIAPNSPLFEGDDEPSSPNGPAGPRRAAPRALSALFMLQTTPEPSSSLSPQSRFTHHLSCDLALSHSQP